MKENCKLLIVFLKLLMLLQRLPVGLLLGEINPLVFNVRYTYYTVWCSKRWMPGWGMAFNGLSLLWISFKFLYSAAHTRHLIQVLRGYFDVFLSVCNTKTREHFIQKWNSNSVMCWLSFSLEQKFACDFISIVWVCVRGKIVDFGMLCCEATIFVSDQSWCR